MSGKPGAVSIRPGHFFAINPAFLRVVTVQACQDFWRLFVHCCGGGP